VAPPRPEAIGVVAIMDQSLMLLVLVGPAGLGPVWTEPRIASRPCAYDRGCGVPRALGREPVGS
jgi:hypothetical protein